MTIQELEEKVLELQEKYECLENKYFRLREWSDDNDYWIREMIDALTESVDKNFDKINNNIYDIQCNTKKIKELITICPYHKECKK